ncbi:MAG: tRNA (adenosine(37)-N6)-threonylcarbamoyltransferase complex dimerization subunit type 1 TsaB [bacterium]
MSTTFLAIEGSYTNLQIALFKDKTCIQKISGDNLKASSTLILKIDEILKQNKIKLSDLDFISVNQGPGAFTSLRVIIATVNGISFATKIPLIGIDGLDALSEQTLNLFSEKENPTKLISLLNAYSNEVYFSVNKINENKLEKIKPNGYEKIEYFLDEIATLRQAQGEREVNKKILFTGNGTTLHKNLIQKKLGSNAIFSENILQTTDVDQIAKMALQKWNQKNDPVYKLKPLYLKTQTFAVKK